MEKSLLKQAVEKMRLGDYAGAKMDYLHARSTISLTAFEYNIALCDRHLERNRNSPTTSHNTSRAAHPFDHIYVVNLKSQVAKKLKIARQLGSYNLGFEIIEAVDGYVGMPAKHFEKYKMKPLGQLTRYPEFNAREIQRGKHFIESAGAIGYIYTYLSILSDAKSKGYKRILILEDDIILVPNFLQVLGKRLANVPVDWKVLHLGASQYDWKSVSTHDAAVKGYYNARRLDTCGSFAIAIDMSIADELIAAQSAFEAPFDHLPMGEIYDRYPNECLVLYPNIVIPDVGDSTIRGKRCQHKHSALMRWPLSSFQYPLPRVSIAVVIANKENLKYFPRFRPLAELPFQLLLYYPSVDGLRPVHWPDHSHFGDEDIVPLYQPIVLPSKVDYCVTPRADLALTEADLLEFIETELFRGNVSPGKFLALDHSYNQIKESRVSVIIPTYKRPDNLGAAIESVCTQEYDDIEIIVVSDNDANSHHLHESRQIVQQAREKFPHREIVLLEHSKNRNGAAARNTGFMHSTGSYLCFLDDDDVYLPGRIPKAILALQETNHSDGAVYCGFIGWNSSSNDIARYKKGNLTQQILELEYRSHYMHTNTITYRRNVVCAINGFDESFRRHQDLEFNLRFFEISTIRTVPEILVQLNPRPSIISNKLHNKQMLDLKHKFLRTFLHLINSLDDSTTAKIYNRHWAEVARYVTDREQYFDMLLADRTNGIAHTVIPLIRSRAQL